MDDAPRRTVKIKLDVPEERRGDFHQTKTQFLHQKGIRRAIEAVTSGVEKLKQGKKTSQPEFDVWSVVYDKRSATFNDDHATLSTPNGRVTVEYVLPPKEEREETPLGRYYGSDDWDASSATLNTTSRTTRSTCTSR